MRYYCRLIPKGRMSEIREFAIIPRIGERLYLYDKYYLITDIIYMLNPDPKSPNQVKEIQIWLQ